MIDNEVRCGQYYLRIWVNQPKQELGDENYKFFNIPAHEEKDFLDNLKNSFRQVIRRFNDSESG